MSFARLLPHALLGFATMFAVHCAGQVGTPSEQTPSPPSIDAGNAGDAGNAPDARDGGDEADVPRVPDGGDTGSVTPFDASLPPAFPAAPIIDGNAPPNAPMLFGGADGGLATGGPCLVEPEVGTLFPRAWLRPRFSLVPAAGQTLFEIRVHAQGQPNDLLVYTTNTSWTMPLAMWSNLSATVTDHDLPMTVQVRSAGFNGMGLTTPPALGSSGPMTIAPASASGSIVYWALTAAGTSSLRGFTVGQETVQDVLLTSQVPNAGCIGCHSSTPDGTFVALTASTNPGDGAPAFIALSSTMNPGQEPPFLTPSARTLLARQQQYVPVFSKAHWASGDHTMISVYNDGSTSQLAWTNLEATSTAQGSGWGVVARTGDPGQPATPAFSHDGTTIVYSSGSSVLGGTSQTRGDGDLYAVPYAGGAGGAATRLTLADDPAWCAIYPAYSADDKVLAFARVPRGSGMLGADPAEEVWVTGATGGAPTRLAANDPAACTGVTSPGIANSWPHWSPLAATFGTRTYYWMIFSSWRSNTSNRVAQLFVTGVVIEGGQVHTYPALYLWNQPANEHNLTPAWDIFDIPTNH